MFIEQAHCSWSSGLPLLGPRASAGRPHAFARAPGQLGLPLSFPSQLSSISSTSSPLFPLLSSSALSPYSFAIIIAILSPILQSLTGLTCSCSSSLALVLELSLACRLVDPPPHQLIKTVPGQAALRRARGSHANVNIDIPSWIDARLVAICCIDTPC